jgi:endo-1,4-beta-D-glucanase Y
LIEGISPMTKPWFSNAFVVVVMGAAAGWGCAPAGGGGSGGGPGSGGAAVGASGGAPGSGTGGASATGGGPATGGAFATGGTAATGGSGGPGPSSSGGSSSTGGAAAGGSGGAAGGAGASAAGGTAGTVPGLGSCLLPAGANIAEVRTAYAKFKTDLLTTDGANGFIRVRRPNSGDPVNSTNSEGIGYGMIAAVYLDDQTVFDQLWKYEQAHLDGNGLMHWEINPAGTAASGTGAATDGDEDMAFALVMADKKWGGSGSLADTYLNVAKKQINLIWQFEVDHTRNDVLTPGDQFSGGQVINISYFAPAYYRIFGKVTGKTAEWNRVVDSTYQALSAALNNTNKNVANGLVPAWSTPAGVPTVPSGTSHPIHHQLDSSRTPFRIGQDYCWFGEARALTYLQKISGFYSQVGAANIVDGYNLDGTAYAGASLHLAAFVGPAGVGAMATPQYAALRDQSRVLLATPPGLLGGSLYYNESWSVLSLLMMSGQFVNLAN